MQVLATTAGLASVNKSRLTVLLVDAKPSTERAPAGLKLPRGTHTIPLACWDTASYDHLVCTFLLVGLRL